MSLPAFEGIALPEPGLSPLQDPFAVSQTAVLELHPEVRTAIDTIQRIYEPVGEDGFVIDGVDYSQYRNRELKRRTSTQSLDGQIEVVTAVGTKLALGVADPTQRREILEDAFKGKIIGSSGRTIIGIYVDGILAQCDTVEKTKAVGGEWMARLGFADDSVTTEQQYEVVKLFAADTYDKDELGESKWIPSATLSEMAMLTDPELHNRLLGRLEQGEYDRQIARDLLRFVATAENVENGLCKVKQLVRFFSATLPTEFVGDKEAYVEERLLAVIADWPADQQRVLVEARQRLTQRLANATTRTGHFIRTNLVAEASDPATAMSAEINTLTSYMAKYAPAGAYGKVAVMQARADLKRRKKSAPEDRSVSLDQAEAKSVVEPWSMVRLRNPGNSHFEIVTEEVDALNSLRMEYLERYAQKVGSPMDLVVQRILARMPGFDFSSGKVPGVVRANSAIRIGTAENATVPLFEYKPTGLADVEGQTSLASRARKLRVLFAMLSDHRLGLLALLERDDMQTFGRNNGIFSGATRRNK